MALGNFPGRDLKVKYEEDILVGYRWYDTKRLPVVYPFGYGLSYTDFSFGNLATDKKTYGQGETIKATFTLTNTGKRWCLSCPTLRKRSGMFSHASGKRTERFQESFSESR